MNEIKLTVIVPVWNAESTLRRCIDSLLSQTLEGIEIIAVDDGSTDTSADILREYEPRIRAIYQEDRGQANAVNHALKYARGEYIAECDSDDYAHRLMYEKLYAKAKKYDADVVKCNYVAFNEFESHTVNVFSSRIWSDKPVNIRDLKYVQKNVIIGHAPSIFCGIYRRQFILDNELFYREGTTFEDTSLMFKIGCAANTFVYILDHLYHYNTGNPNSGTNTIRNNIGIIEQFEEIQRFNQLRKLNLDPWVAVYGWYCFMWAYDRIDNDADRRTFLLGVQSFLEPLPIDPFIFNTAEDFDACMAVRNYGKKIL